MNRIAIVFLLLSGCAAKTQALNSCSAGYATATAALVQYRAAAKAHDEVIVKRGGGDELVDDRLMVAKERGDLARPLVDALSRIPEVCRGR